jgi:hypothetical protein
MILGAGTLGRRSIIAVPPKLAGLMIRDGHPLFVVLTGFDYYAPDMPANFTAHAQKAALAISLAGDREPVKRPKPNQLL